MEEKLKILVVDDEHDALELFKDLFTSEGYEVECALSGMEALNLVDRSAIDVVLLDIKMPEMDGNATLARLKEKNPQLPVVMLTAYGYDEGLIDRALKLGAVGYISKNLALVQIVHTFKTLLNVIHRKKKETTT